MDYTECSKLLNNQPTEILPFHAANARQTDKFVANKKRDSKECIFIDQATDQNSKQPSKRLDTNMTIITSNY